MNSWKLKSTRHTALLIGLLIISILFISVALIPEKSHAAHMFTPTTDISAQKDLDVAVSYETLHLKSGGSLTFIITVTESGFPVSNSSVSFTSDHDDSCSFEYENGGTTDSDGRATVLMTAYSENGMIINLTVKAVLEGHMPGYYEISEITVEPPTIIINNERISYISITGILTFILIASTEAGKYGIFKLFFLPLYSRLKKDDLLDHFVRGQIYGYIMSHPGEHYNHIKTSLEVTNGTLSHHLRALELQGYIKSQRDGTYKRFYPTDMKIPRTKGIKLSDLQIGIIDAIRQSPGLSQKEIARREGISQQTVSYNLSLLKRLGILDSSREGVRKKYYITVEA